MLNGIIDDENRGDILDFIISFFRDILDGSLYIIVSVICGILICSCIGYLGEQYLNKQKKKKEFDETHTGVVNTMPVALNNSNSVNAKVVQSTVSAQDVSNVTANQGQ